MTKVSPADPTRVRAAEVLGSLALATDLGTGQPLDRALRTCLLALRLAQAVQLDDSVRSDVYHVALLRFLGCTSDVVQTARLVHGDGPAFLAAMAPSTLGAPAEQLRALVPAVAPGSALPVRAVRIAQVLSRPGWGNRSLATHCEVAARLGRRLGCGVGVVTALGHAYERWDGTGVPDGLAGAQVPWPVRIVAVAGDVVLHAREGGPEAVDRMLTARRGRAHAPEVVDACRRVGPAELDRLDRVDLWAEVMAAGPAGPSVLTGPALDEALTAVADFTDLATPALCGHSRRVAGLAEGAARWCGLAEDEAVGLRHAGLVHDVGRIGVPGPGRAVSGRSRSPATIAQRERERMHPYLTERVLAHCTGLAGPARTAAVHHERMDGTGYPAGLRGPRLDVSARLLAAADVLDLAEAESGAEAGRSALRRGVREGGIDPAAADAVLATRAGRTGRGHHRRPAGLSAREAQVLRLLATGMTNRQIAATLRLSVKTVGRHVDHVYAKTGTHSRAAAAVLALEQGVLDGGGEP